MMVLFQLARYCHHRAKPKTRGQAALAFSLCDSPSIILQGYQIVGLSTQSIVHKWYSEPYILPPISLHAFENCRLHFRVG